MKKVAFVINSLQGGGAERALARLTMELPREWEIDIVLLDSSNIAYEYRGNIIDLKIPKSKTISYFVKSFLKRFYVLRKLKKSKCYDACVGFTDSANIVNIMTGNRYCKVVTSVRTTLSQADRHKGYRYIVSPLAKILYNKSDVVIAVSEGVKLDLIKNYGIGETRIKTICNGYDFKKIDFKLVEALTETELGFFQEGKNTVVTMGRLDLAKAQWHLIRAFSEVVQVVPNVQLLILGEGELEKYLKELVEKLDLTEKVLFGGFQKNPFHILARCQIFVFPSLFEGFPNALVEAMYCGLPIIATDFHTGAREILAPDTNCNETLQHGIEYASYGILTPVCDGVQYQAMDSITEEEQFIAKAMIELLLSEELQKSYAQKAKDRSRTYGIGVFARRWMEILEEK